MAKSNNPMHVLIFQCGWETKSLHTIFSYIFTSLSNDVIFEKTLAHWFFKQSNEIHGGVPQTLDNIRTEADYVNFSVNLLSVHRTQLTLKTEFKYILADTVVRIHDVFLVIIRNKPYGKYKDQTNHLIHHFWDILLCVILLWFLFTQLLSFYDEQFYSKYPFGNFMEDSKFDELSKFLQSHC